MKTNRFLIAICLLYALTSVGSARADCYDTTRWGQRGNIHDVAVDGTRLYAADGLGIALWDVSDATLPRQVASVESAAPSEAVALTSNGPLLLTDGRLELHSADTLQLLSSRPADAMFLAASGSLAVTAEPGVTLWKTAAGQLMAVGSSAVSGNVLAVTFVGGFLYVGKDDSTVVFDVRGGTLVPFTTLAAPARTFALNGTTLYAIGTGVITAIDVSSAPLIIGHVNVPDTVLIDATAANGTLWATDGRRLFEYSLADPAHPSLTDSAPLQAASVVFNEGKLYVLPVSGDFGFPAESKTPVVIYSAALPLDEIGTIRSAEGPLGGVATDGQFAYVADAPYFRVLDITSGVPHTIATLPLGDYSDRVLLNGSMAIVYGRGNVHLIDISNPYEPVESGVHHTGGRPFNGVTMAGPYLLSADAISGLHVLDISNPAAPIQIGSFYNDLTGRFTGVIAATPTAVYIAADNRVRMADLSNPRHPVAKGFFSLDARYLQTSTNNPTGRSLLFAVDLTTLYIYDITSPFSPVLIGSIPVSSGPIAVAGNRIYVAGRNGELQTISFANPFSPVMLSHEPLFRSPRQIAVTPSGDILAAEQYYLTLAHPSSGDAPVLSLEMRSRESAHLSWTGGAAQYLVELSPNPDMSSASSGVVSANELFFSPSARTYARVTALSRCASSPSNIVTIDPSTAPAVRFVGSSQVYTIRPGDPLTVNAVVANEGDAVFNLTIDASGRVQAGSPVVVAAHSRVAVPVTIDTAGVVGRITVPVTANGVAGPFSVTLVPATLGTGTISSGATVLPGIGATAGANLTQWNSEVYLFCRRGPCDVTLAYAPFGTSQETTETQIRLNEGESTVLQNVVRSLFGLNDTAGVVYVKSTGDVVTSARTFNNAPAGRYGQHIPPAPASPATLQFIPGMRWDDVARTNVGFIEMSGRQTDVVTSLYSPDGALIASGSLTLAPYQRVQEALTALVGAGQGSRRGTLRIQTSTPVVAWASRVDQQTGDGVFIYAAAAPVSSTTGNELVMPIAGSTSGANTSEWRTGLELFNPSGANVPIELVFVGNDGAVAARVQANLPALGSLSIDDYRSFFGGNVDVSTGSILVRSSTPLVGWGRVYNQTPAGTYGQQVPLMVPPTTSRVGSLIGLEQSAVRRTNIGLTETMGSPVTVRIALFDSGGQLVGATELGVAPHQVLSLLGALQTLGGSGLAAARIDVDVIGGNGSVIAWSSVAEQTTGDAVFTLAE